MALTPGTHLGVYKVVAPIGEGGMGQVYRARDTKLDRDVAIKILPDAFASDPERLARFQREAKTLASLNHPNIAAIYGLEENGGMTALVMELVEGDDLSQRIARGAIPMDEALPIAKQIAEALEAAHERGIIHRDLKPANIKVRADGTVRVLDFGLAKAMEPMGAMSPGLSMSPTLSLQATQAGMILGTAGYMSPEQARGKTVDKRADIWAFGAVLFEMLTGKRAFPGEDITDTLAAVVRAEPEWSLVPRAISPTLLVFLRRSLQKDPKQRLGDIRDMRLALEGAFETAASQTVAPTTSCSLRKGPYYLYQKPAIGAGTEELLLATAQDKIPTDWSPDGRLLLYRSVDPKTGYDLWALPMNGDGKPFPVVQTNFDERDAQFSPDGKWIAYQSNESGRFEIYIQPFPGPGSKLQVSTNGGVQMRWGPNGKELFYIALDARLMAVPIRLASNPQTAEPGSPTPLFATRVGGALQGTFRQQYDVSSDAPRFLMNTITEEAASPITVILNWNPAAKK